MTLLFLQRAEQIQATYRKPFYETESYRASALVGPRFFWIEDKFRWTTTDLDYFGQSSPIYEGIYNNQVDNRMYGVRAGLQQEWYLGCGFAAMLTTEAAAFHRTSSTSRWITSAATRAARRTSAGRPSGPPCRSFRSRPASCGIPWKASNSTWPGTSSASSTPWLVAAADRFQLQLPGARLPEHVPLFHRLPGQRRLHFLSGARSSAPLP